MWTLPELRDVLGGEIAGHQVVCPGPGHSHRDRSLAVRPSDTSPLGFVAHSYASDTWPEIRDYVCDKLGIEQGQPAAPIDPAERMRRRAEAAAQERAQAARKKRLALILWREAIGLPGTLAARYLESRAIPVASLTTTVLRFHPECIFGEGTKAPCLVALMHDIQTGEPVAIHRTALSPEGEKIDRKMLGPSDGAAIMLDEAVNDLVIGEGIETALSARLLGIRGPAWALGSAGQIKYLPVLAPGLRLTLLEELGDGGASARAVLACGTRWQAAGRSVSVIRPRVGSDLNDQLRSTTR